MPYLILPVAEAGVDDPRTTMKKIGIEENGDATAVSFTSQSECFKGKTETFSAMRFFLELTQHIPPKGSPAHSTLRPVCFPHQGEMAGQAPRGAVGYRGVEEAATAGGSRPAALRGRGARFDFLPGKPLDLGEADRSGV